MADPKKKPDVKKAGPTGPAKGQSGNSARWKNYSVEGGKLTRKNKFCPKCGNGVFLAAHKNRVTCGQCGYTEMKRN